MPPKARPATAASGRGLVGSAWNEVFADVEFTPTLLAFLYYFFVITTYWLPGADVAMVVAFATLAMAPQDLRAGRANILSALFVVWCWISYFSSALPKSSFETTWTITKVWMVAFVAYNALRSVAQVRFFLLFATVCWVFFPMRGAFVNYFGGYTLMGRALWNHAYANPNDLAAYAILYTGLAASLLPFVRSRLLKLAVFGAIGMSFLLIFFTQSRGALLAVGIVTAGLILSRIRNPRMVFGAVAMVTVTAFFAPKSVWQRLSGLGNASMESGMKGVDEEHSAEQRLQLMKLAARVAADYPVAGVGPGVYPIMNFRYARMGAGADLELAKGRRDAHNTYLRTAADTGYVGLFIFLTMIIGVGAQAFRHRSRRAPAMRERLLFLALGLMAYMLAGIFGSFQYLSLLYLYLVVINALAIADQRPPERVMRRPVRRLLLAQPTANRTVA